MLLNLHGLQEEKRKDKIIWLFVMQDRMELLFKQSCFYPLLISKFWHQIPHLPFYLTYYLKYPFFGEELYVVKSYNI